KNRPVTTFIFTNPDATTKTVTTPDPGRALITGNQDDINFFKIPSLWNVKATAPYFHDDSAQTLEELVHHYNNFFTTATNGGLPLSAQDEADIVAYLKLLCYDGGLTGGAVLRPAPPSAPQTPGHDGAPGHEWGRATHRPASAPQPPVSRRNAALFQSGL